MFAVHQQRSFIENMRENVQGLITLVTNKFGKSKFAKSGIAFVLTYSIISKLIDSIAISVAWYIVSQTVSTTFPYHVSK